MAGPTHGKNPPANQLDFGIVTGQHWRTWDELVEQWQWADESGLDSAWAFDHFFSLRDGEMGPVSRRLDAAGGAGRQDQQRPDRPDGQRQHPPQPGHPRQAGRHRRHHLRRAADPRRRRRLERARARRLRHRLPVPARARRPLRRGDGAAPAAGNAGATTFNGDYYTLDDAPFEPKPVFGHIPILIGSTGKRMLRHVARYADQWDGGGTPDEMRATGERLNAACAEIGRDPSEIRWALSTGSRQVRIGRHLPQARPRLRRRRRPLVPLHPARRLAQHHDPPDRIEVIPELREEWKGS